MKQFRVLDTSSDECLTEEDIKIRTDWEQKIIQERMLPEVAQRCKRRSTSQVYTAANTIKHPIPGPELGHDHRANLGVKTHNEEVYDP